MDIHERQLQRGFIMTADAGPVDVTDVVSADNANEVGQVFANIDFKGKKLAYATGAQRWFSVDASTAVMTGSV